MRRKTIILFATVGAIVLAVGVAWPRIGFYMLTGHFSPIEKIETLQNPSAVTSWGSDGFSLANGRTVPIPGLRLLPAESAALREVTQRGVEVDADGRVWGLVRVHHRCGNDPVRVHIARVDVANLMTFLRVGEPVGAAPEAEFLVDEPARLPSRDGESGSSWRSSRG